ncbi:MAG TPA: hypothetical protein VIG25_09310 [Pyrinomonadaceae bacterium]
MLPNTLQVKWPAITLTLLGLLLGSSPPCYSQQKDVFGWQSARWGMSNGDIVRVFGVRLKKLAKSEVFLGMHVDYVIPELQLESENFTLYFQISDATSKLSQILIRLNEQNSPVPREKIFNSLESLLERQYGKPLERIDERRTSSDGFVFIDLTRIWRFPTTTVELAYGWDNQIDASLLTIRYFPTKVMQRTTPNKALQLTAR